MFDPIKTLKDGTERQRKAFEAIDQLNVLADLAEYNPILCGTVPLGIDVEQSDLDMIMEVDDLTRFKENIIALYRDKADFQIKETEIRGNQVIKANFYFLGFEFELFGQAVPTKEQNAYRHMVIEHVLLERYPDLKANVIQLKKQGIKTEPAFCQVLGIHGDDPYEDLLIYGRELLGG